jgi:hypothetical protein
VMPDPRRLDSTTPHIWGVIVCKAINDKWKEKCFEDREIVFNSSNYFMLYA